MPKTDTAVAMLEIPSAVAFHSHLEASDVRVYLALVHFTTAGWDRPTKAGIADLARVNRNTVAVALKRLAREGLVSVDTTAAPHAYSLAA